MFYGESTKELDELDEIYHDMFGIYPFGHMELEYGASQYKEYVRDIKKAIQIKKPLTSFVK